MPDPDADLFGGGDEGTPGGEPGSAGAPGSDPNGGTPDSKRVADLLKQLAAQTSRADKLAAEAKPAAPAAPGPDLGAPAPAALPPEMVAAIDELREGTRRGVFASSPLFAKYGIEPSLIAGSTHAEMSESASRLSTLLEAIETKAANAALAEHGLVPNGGAGAPAKKLGDLATMPSEEFEKLVQAGKQGAFQRR